MENQNAVKIQNWWKNKRPLIKLRVENSKLREEVQQYRNVIKIQRDLHKLSVAFNDELKKEKVNDMFLYNSRIEFHRIFTSLCSLNNKECVLFGDFLYNAISGKPVMKTSMKYYFNSIRVYKEDVEKIIQTLFDINISVKEIQPSPEISDNYVWKLIVNIKGSTFIVQIYLNKPFIMPCFDVHNLELGKNGLSTHCLTQYHLKNQIRDNGTAVLSMIGSLRTKTAVSLMNDSELVCGETVYDRTKICSYLQIENDLINDGITIINGSKRTVIEKCPVCLESNISNAIRLVCNHSFCLDCIVKHFTDVGYSNTCCPLCRCTFGISRE